MQFYMLICISFERERNSCNSFLSSINNLWIILNKSKMLFFFERVFVVTLLKRKEEYK
jgi:hypothetical protein